MNHLANTLYEFGPFRMDTHGRVLLQEGKPIHLAPKAFDILLVLVENSGRLLSKDELMQNVWPDVVVEEINLARQISNLRKTLARTGGKQDYIETVSKRGYIFTTEVRVVSLQVKSVAVLPFKPLDAQSNDEQLSLGLADALINKLSNIRAVVVRPTSAILRFASVQQDSLATGSQLGVEALLEGSVQRAADKIRISVQLVRVSDGAPLWAGTFDEQFTNIFAVQDSISLSVARALALKLNPVEARLLPKRHTDNAEAYRLYLRGRFHALKRTDESFQKAIDLYQQAVALDPNFALAYAGLADCYIGLGLPEATLGGIPSQEATSKAEAMAKMALALDNTLSEAHAAMGAVIGMNSFGRGAEQEFQRAIELNPNNALARSYYSYQLNGNLRFDEALEQVKQAVEIDPLSIPFNTQLAMVLYRMRRYDEAIRQCLKTMELEPNFVRTRWILGMAYEQKGMFKEALAELERANALAGGRPVLLASLAHAHAVSGNHQEAEKIIAELLDASKHKYVSPVYLAVIYVGLGQKDKAFALLEKAYRERAASLGVLEAEQRFDPLRTDPRYYALLQRLEIENAPPK